MNIQQMIQQLLAIGMTQRGIADEVPCHQTTISAYLQGTRGARVSADIYNKILAIYELKTGVTHNRRKTDKDYKETK